MTKKHQLFLVLDGATSLLWGHWGATQQEGTEPVTQDLDAYTLMQAKVGSSRHGLLHSFLDDFLEDPWG